jgi:hypothetical protein
LALGCENVEIVQLATRNDQLQCGYSIIIRQPHPFGTEFTQVWANDDTDIGAKIIKWDDGHTWDGNIDKNLVDVLFEICAQNRGAHANPRTIVIVHNGDIDIDLQPIGSAEITEINISYRIDRG